MPFDGFVTKCIAEELNIVLAGGRIDKVQQPERDEILLTVRNHGRNHRLLISSNASTPRIHLTEGSKENPGSAPMFCMILRKHIGGGRVTGVCAKGLERVVEISVESPDELGDVSTKTLVAEIMGKHSNIILLNQDGRIIDAVVHVDQDMSSVREVMPARPYVPPPPQGKIVPAPESCGAIADKIAGMLDAQPMAKIGTALLDVIMGASPLFCRELCRKAGFDDRTPLALIGRGEIGALRAALASVLGDAYGERYSPCVVYRDDVNTNMAFVDGAEKDMIGVGGADRGADSAGGAPEADGYRLQDFYCWKVVGEGAGIRLYATMSEAADAYYDGRSRAASLAQRKAWMAKLVSSNIARCKKKLAILGESMREAAGRDAFKLCGELITANIYQIRQGDKSARLLNYYAAGTGEGEGEYVDVALDGDISPQANAQAYFKKYRKLASAWTNAGRQAAESERELAYLESVQQELEMARDRQEIDEIRQELASQKYAAEGQVGRDGQKSRGRPSGGGKQSGKPSGRLAGKPPSLLSKPHCFTSSDGLLIYVGKNNRQNDQLTLRDASPNDVWLHARGVPGSHVVIKKQQGEVPQGTLLEAASLAAYFSKARMGGNAGVDYTAVRHVRKPSGAKPGMVIYDSQRTLTVKPDESLLARLGTALGGRGPGGG